MTNYKKQLVSVLAAGTVLLNLAGPAFAASTTVQITGNGAGSDNYAQVNQSNTNTVTQSNTANVTNNVTANANTGNNDANFNTGGDVTVHTGAAQTVANVTNTLNSNAAQINGCCASNTDVLISGNGAYSDNTVTLDKTNTNTVNQTNYADVTNEVELNAKTGGNGASSNTGGDVLVVTGPAASAATVRTTANSNVAVIGGGSAMPTPTASFRIVGNGAGSNNWIDANLSTSNLIYQDNYANIYNDVDVNAKTGYNDADFNTGGDVIIGTGAAGAAATVDNMVNFNYANVDCGCVFDVLAKIEGNGANQFGHGWDWWFNQPDNTILLTLANDNVIGQGNDSYLMNEVEANAKTGENDVLSNTGSVYGGDPAIITGPATDVTNVSNSGNVNTVGGTPFVLPIGSTNIGLSFNMQALLAFFGLSIH